MSVYIHVHRKSVVNDKVSGSCNRIIQLRKLLKSVLYNKQRPHSCRVAFDCRLPTDRAAPERGRQSGEFAQGAPAAPGADAPGAGGGAREDEKQHRRGAPAQRGARHANEAEDQGRAGAQRVCVRSCKTR